MTKKYLIMTSNEQKPEPFLLRPAGKDYLWGGTRLKTEFGKILPMEPLAETWECSTHPDGPSVAASGVFCGMELSEIIQLHPEYIGGHAAKLARRIGAQGLPILVKLIDADRDLSIQVHPDDDYALKNEDQPGKTEVWYVLDAVPDAEMIYGFRQPMEKESVRRAVIDGSIIKYLNKIKIHKDEVYYIQSGRVHAIGAGSLIAEIQENSNVTYRLFDYNRRGSDGEKRSLLVDKALDVADLDSSEVLKQPLRVLRYAKGSASELLCSCEYFSVYRTIINNNSSIPLRVGSGMLSFKILLCIEGKGSLEYRGHQLDLVKGSCLFIPAGICDMSVYGKAQFLLINS